MENVIAITLAAAFNFAEAPSLLAAGESSTAFTQKNGGLLFEFKIKIEQIDKRFQLMLSFIGILAVIFTVMTIGSFGFTVWDRHTMIRPLKVKVQSTADSKFEKVMAALLHVGLL